MNDAKKKYISRNTGSMGTTTRGLYKIFSGQKPQQLYKTLFDARRSHLNENENFFFQI